MLASQKRSIGLVSIGGRCFIDPPRALPWVPGLPNKEMKAID